MAPKTRPAVMTTIDPNGDEIVIRDPDDNEIIIQVCGSSASRMRLRISGSQQFKVDKQARSKPVDPLLSVTPHPRSAGGGTDARMDGTRQP
jgi:hypothetical protein